jgi:pre-mRNA cleavage complex 2 protein Pcf11
MKLPAFYLLDAISKNVYEPYARHFATFVIPLFLEAYDQVDQNTRSKMEEMLLTWRTGSPTGKELFGVVPQVAIERGVWGGESTHGADVSGSSGHRHNKTFPKRATRQSSQSANGFYSGSGQINKSMVLSELEFTVGQKERALQANPYDSTSQNHLNVLQQVCATFLLLHPLTISLQLRKLVEAGVSQEELRQILSQLRALVRSVPPPASSSSGPPPQAYPPPYPSQPQYPPFLPTSSQSPYPQPPHSYPSFEQVKTEGFDLSSTVGSQAVSSSGPDPSSTSAGNIANLFNALVKAGVVSASATPTGAGATAQGEDSKPDDTDLEKKKSRSYRKAILAQKIKLTSADITKYVSSKSFGFFLTHIIHRTRPQIVNLLYDQLPAQCKQCGVRFADNSLGKRKMEDHLDMHFRQNRKANQNIGRGHSRSWFIGVEVCPAYQ